MFHKNHTVPVGILHLSIHTAADDLMPKSDMAFFDKNLSLLTAKVWLI